MSFGDLTPEMLENELKPYTDMGGYPLMYLDGQSDILCAKCANEALNDPDEYEEWKPKTWFIHYEGQPIFCSICSEITESAYGDPDEKPSYRFKVRVRVLNEDKTLHPHEGERVFISVFDAETVMEARAFIEKHYVEGGEYITSLHFLEHEVIA